jgi:hypothetical protein
VHPLERLEPEYKIKGMGIQNKREIEKTKLLRKELL